MNLLHKILAENLANQIPESNLDYVYQGKACISRGDWYLELNFSNNYLRRSDQVVVGSTVPDTMAPCAIELPGRGTYFKITGEILAEVASFFSEFTKNPWPFIKENTAADFDQIITYVKRCFAKLVSKDEFLNLFSLICVEFHKDNEEVLAMAIDTGTRLGYSKSDLQTIRERIKKNVMAARRLI